MIQRVSGRSEAVLRGMTPGQFDLVLTSPPAYPSPDQASGSLGTEDSVSKYVDSLGRTLFLCRRLLRPDGFMVLVIEPLPGQSPLGMLAIKLKRMLFRVLASYQWDSGDGRRSLVIFLARGSGARLNRSAPAWRAAHWAIPAPPPDSDYGFYEWPVELVQAIVDLTIPGGGKVLDPFAGKAVALASLGDEFDVTAVDVRP